MGITLDVERQKTPLVMKASLSLVSKSHTLRCDSKQAECRFQAFDKYIASVEHFFLGDFLPQPFAKGRQPKYIENLEPEGIPVISTLAIQQLRIITSECRFITQDDYDDLPREKKPKKNDVLLTVDGGTSIGKPVLFDLDDDYAIDSHIVILRPSGLEPKVLVYLLASPLGQLQFQRAESGASGQTGVTEEDIRRFRFPVLKPADLQKNVSELDSRLTELETEVAKLHKKEEDAWSFFNAAIVGESKKVK